MHLVQILWSLYVVFFPIVQNFHTCWPKNDMHFFLCQGTKKKTRPSNNKSFACTGNNTQIQKEKKKRIVNNKRENKMEDVIWVGLAPLVNEGEHEVEEVLAEPIICWTFCFWSAIKVGDPRNKGRDFCNS